MCRKRRPLAALALIATVALISACGSSAPAETGTGSGLPSTDTRFTFHHRALDTRRPLMDE